MNRNSQGCAGLFIATTCLTPSNLRNCGSGCCLAKESLPIWVSTAIPSERLRLPSPTTTPVARQNEYDTAHQIQTGNPWAIPKSARSRPRNKKYSMHSLQNSPCKNPSRRCPLGQKTKLRYGNRALQRRGSTPTTPSLTFCRSAESKYVAWLTDVIDRNAHIGAHRVQATVSCSDPNLG